MIKNIMTALFLAVFLQGCQKDEIIRYESEAGIALYTNMGQADSTVYSFAFFNDNVVTDTLYVPIRLQGKTATHDRYVEMMALPGTDAVEGTDFVLPRAVLKADSMYMQYPVILHRSAPLKAITKSLVITVKENADFRAAGLGQSFGRASGSTEVSIAKYKIKFNDYFSEPSYWPRLQAYGVGLFSAVKFQFMLNVYDTNDLSLLGTADLYNMSLKLRRALADYELIYGPLIDEKGQRVEFELN